MSAPRSLRTALLATALAAALTGVGCGGGGGGGGGTPPPTQPQPGVTFTGSSVAAPAVRLARGAGSSGAVLEVEVRADQLPTVYGLAFDLTFPSSVLRFDAFAEGSFLSGGAQTSLQVAEAGAGRLVVGHSRLGNVAAASGSGVLMTLRFVAVGSGSGSFSFSSNEVFDTAGKPVPGTAWGGATVQVTM